jgi:hypothetical protein
MGCSVSVYGLAMLMNNWCGYTIRGVVPGIIKVRV